MRRERASASATRLVSMVIQRRPHCSATYAVVPEPHVGSSTRSPGSVVMSKQRFTSSSICLNHVDLIRSSTQAIPPVGHLLDRWYRRIADKSHICSERKQAISKSKPCHSRRHAIVGNNSMLP